MMSVRVARMLNLPFRRLPGAVSPLSFLNILLDFVSFFLAARGLCCCVQAFSSCGEQGLRFAVCADFSLRRLLLHRRALGVGASVVVAHGLSLSATCGIFPDQGLNPCPLHWQMES